MRRRVESKKKSQGDDPWLLLYVSEREEGLLLARCGVSVLEGAVVLGLTLGDNPCPLVAIVRSDSGYVGLEEATAIGPCLTYDGVAPTLVVEPVVTFAPKVETTIELDFGHQVVAGLQATKVMIIIGKNKQFYQKVVL